REVRTFMDRGDLVPDDLVVAMLVERLESTSSGFILDGFPRTVAQAEALERALSDRGLDLDAVLSFDIDPEAGVARLSARPTRPANLPGLPAGLQPVDGPAARGREL